MRKRISDYSGSKVNGDWMPSIAAMRDALGAGGGIYEIDANIELKSAFETIIPENTPFRLNGEGNLIYLNAGSAAQVLRVSNKTEFLIEDVIAHGDQDKSKTDCSIFVLTNAYDRAMVRDSTFAGIKASSAIFYFYQTNALVKDSRFGGCAAPSNVYADGCRDVILERVRFYDYVQLGGSYFTNNQTYFDAVGSDAWVKAENAPASTSAFTPTVRFDDCRFDEGAEKAVVVDSYPNVFFEHCRVNVNATNEGIGFRVKGAKVVEIKDCWFGLNSVDNRRAVQLENVEFACLENITLSHGVKKLEFLGTTKKVVLKNCWYDYNGVRRRLTISDIINTANAEVQIDNIIYRNGKTTIL